MDRLTEQIVNSIRSRSARGHLTVDVDSVTCDGSFSRSIRWRVKTLPSFLPATTYALRYCEAGSVLVSCSSDITVLSSEMSDERWVLSYIDIKGGYSDSDVEVVIKEVSRGRPAEERLILTAAVSRWPHLDKQLNVWLELGLIVKAAAFDISKKRCLPLLSLRMRSEQT